jgi:hypothetical protein
MSESQVYLKLRKQHVDFEVVEDFENGPQRKQRQRQRQASVKSASEGERCELWTTLT